MSSLGLVQVDFARSASEKVLVAVSINISIRIINISISLKYYLNSLDVPLIVSTAIGLWKHRIPSDLRS